MPPPIIAEVKKPTLRVNKPKLPLTIVLLDCEEQGIIPPIAPSETESTRYERENLFNLSAVKFNAKQKLSDLFNGDQKLAAQHEYLETSSQENDQKTTLWLDYKKQVTNAANVVVNSIIDAKPSTKKTGGWASFVEKLGIADTFIDSANGRFDGKDASPRTYVSKVNINLKEKLYT